MGHLYPGYVSHNQRVYSSVGFFGHPPLKLDAWRVRNPFFLRGVWSLLMGKSTNFLWPFSTANCKRLPEGIINNIYPWLVVITILKNMSSSMGRMTFHIWWKIKHVPNHQPVFDVSNFPVFHVLLGGFKRSHMYCRSLVGKSSAKFDHQTALIHLYIYIYISIIELWHETLPTQIQIF